MVEVSGSVLGIGKNSDPSISLKKTLTYFILIFPIDPCWVEVMGMHKYLENLDRSWSYGWLSIFTDFIHLFPYHLHSFSASGITPTFLHLCDRSGRQTEFIFPQPTSVAYPGHKKTASTFSSTYFIVSTGNGGERVLVAEIKAYILTRLLPSLAVVNSYARLTQLRLLRFLSDALLQTMSSRLSSLLRYHHGRLSSKQILEGSMMVNVKKKEKKKDQANPSIYLTDMYP